MSTITEAGYLTNLTYDDIVNWTNVATNNSVDEWIQIANGYGISEYDAVMDLAGRNMNFYQNADGLYTISSFNVPAESVTTSVLDSNATTIARGNLQIPINRGVDAQTGNFNMSTTPASGGFTSGAKYFLGCAGTAFSCLSVGCMLGKAVDSALYNANPDYWDSIGLSTLNPETWNSITNGDDSWQAGYVNMMLGLDPSTGKSQAYMDANALGYFAYALKENGWFNDGGAIVDNVPAGLGLNSNYYPVVVGPMSCYGESISQPIREINFNAGGGAMYTQLVSESKYKCLGVLASPVRTSVSWASRTTYNRETERTTIENFPSVDLSSTYTYDGKTVYYQYVEISNVLGVACTNISVSGGNPYSKWPYYQWGQLAWALLYGSTPTSSVDGVTNQPNATLPDTSTWTNPQTTLQSLQSQYPDLFTNSIVFDNVQPDGTNPQITYVPITLPNTTNPLDTQPTTGTQTQTDIEIDPDTSPENIIKLITSLITQPNPQIEPVTETTSETQQPPQNPTPTGTGSTPPVVAPTGSASALWCIYHPTQSQVNSFGGWLWSTNFVDQLLKIFQNPMDAIISLKKVFVTPVDAGTSTIHAGYLDSGVSSAYVTQQYISVDCGSVNCYEQFGNVFDYNDTNISLYLPFIGIVPLNTTEVMRSTIHIIYTVDIINGTCLATVEINRDGNSAVLYQYSGDASVDYPVSGSRSGGLLTGLVTAVGAAASIATGGAALPAAGAAVAGVAAMSQKQVQHSGGFSGSAGAMGCKIPYLIIERPQTKVADKFVSLDGYPTNYSGVLSDFSGQVTVTSVHVEGMSATDTELSMIETLLKDGVLI